MVVGFNGYSQLTLLCSVPGLHRWRESGYPGENEKEEWEEVEENAGNRARQIDVCLSFCAFNFGEFIGSCVDFFLNTEISQQL